MQLPKGLGRLDGNIMERDSIRGGCNFLSSKSKALGITLFICILLLLLLNGCIGRFTQKYGYVAGDIETVREDGKLVFIPDNAPSTAFGFFPDLEKDNKPQRTKNHNGIDIIADIGTPVIAPASGVVIGSYFEPFFGHCIVISHGRRYEGLFIKSNYFHLNKRWVQKGDTVVRGQVIGELGRTGLLAGGAPHLHFEIRGSETLHQPLTRPLNPHRFWYDGPGIVTCFDPGRNWDDSLFRTTYPVRCRPAE